MFIMVLPFAGMTRIRFQGSRPEASSQPVCADSPSTDAIVHPQVFFVKLGVFSAQSAVHWVRYGTRRDDS